MAVMRAACGPSWSPRVTACCCAGVNENDRTSMIDPAGDMGIEAAIVDGLGDEVIGRFLLTL